MTNLLRRCENCVNGRRRSPDLVACIPELPFWAVEIISEVMRNKEMIVHNDYAELCPAFRLRDIGENRNV